MARSLMEALFWATCALLAYLHGGYLLVLRALSLAAGRRPTHPGPPTGKPLPITVLVGAYNEERDIGPKLDSLLAQDYPGPLRIIVVSDCSSDGTDAIVRSYAQRGVELVRMETRSGKAANFSRVLPGVDTDLVVLTDAGSRFHPDVVRRLADPFADPGVGLVGARVVYRNVDASGVARGEGLYWRYEVALRTLESRWGGTVIISGAGYAIRRRLWRPVPPELPDDCMSPLNVLDQGGRVVYDPDAVIVDEVVSGAADEYRTKVRIISRNVVGLWRMRRLLSPLRHPVVSWKLLSHRLLRWLVLPQLALVLALSVALSRQPLYRLALAAQALLYLAALLGLVPRLRSWKPVYIPYYFVLVNLAAFVGVLRALRGRISGVWSPAR